MSSYLDSQSVFENEIVKTFVMAYYFYKHDPEFRAYVDQHLNTEHLDPALVEKLRAFKNEGKLFSLSDD